MDRIGRRWDLWCVWSDSCNYERLPPFGDSGHVTEFRVYERVPKRDLWFVGTRTFRGRRFD